MRFNGAVYDPAFDDERLSKQLGRVFNCMIDGKWRTLDEISSSTHDPHASVSAQLRHLRKDRFGSYIVNKRPRGNRMNGLFEYQVLPRQFDKSGQGQFPFDPSLLTAAGSTR
jgi:hypothetical protein